VGERGAIVKIKSNAKASNADGTQGLDAAIYLLNARNTLIYNIEFQPIEGDGGVAILTENSHCSAVMNCTISNHQVGVLVENSNYVAILNNKITVTSAWQTGALSSAFGIVVMNGSYAKVVNNTVSSAIFGIWACDKYGVCDHNTTTGSVIGIILCNVPMGIILPDGRLTGSKVPGAFWKTRHNLSTDNQYGYVIIDGANNNLIENNNAARNAAYDMELTTDTYRFGFLTPKSFKNKVIAGRYQHIRIKDCGENNTVIGGVKVDTGSDPCN
jgi:hypothetical protein